jgi:DNA primase
MRVHEVSILQVLNDYYGLDLDTRDDSERKTVCCLAGHEDHRPSLMLYPRENTAYCFGCQTWLDPARAVELKLACSRTVACRELNEKYNLGLITEELNQRELYEKEFAAYIDAAQTELQRHPEAINALETRGITDALIAQNRIGYAPQRYDHNVLKVLGVIQFSECIVLPLYFNGQLVGVQGWNYAGRGNRPKYLYPSKHHKALWGSTPGYELVILVEGYFDALSLRAANIPVLCAGGTHINRDGKDFLKTFNTVVIVFDNDDAGLKAAEKLATELPNAKLVTAEAWGDVCLGLDIKDVSDLWQNV